MYGLGRPPLSTSTERERVRSLAADGESIRRIAELVFGDRRYRGRVERILRAKARAEGQTARVRQSAVTLEGLVPPGTPVLSLRELVAAHREQLERAGEDASLRDVQTLLKLERQLAAREEIERLNALTWKAE